MKIIFYASIDKITQNLLRQIKVKCLSCKLKDNKRGNIYDLDLECIDVKNILNLDKKNILQITFKSKIDLITDPEDLKVEHLQVDLSLKNKRLSFEKSLIEESYSYFISRD